MMQTAAHIRATNRWIEKKRDRITIVTLKGNKERIKQAAAGAGNDSINDMILAALEQYTGLEGLRLKGDEKG
jgi:NRPS condensation-like uncharacterized protein